MSIFDSIKLDPRQDASLVQQIKQQITWLIANGQLRMGDLLPPVRNMATKLNINVNTVRAAYQKLEADGLVEIRQGRGTLVMPFDLSKFAQVQGVTRSHTVGISVPSWSNPFYHAFLQGVEEIAEKDQTLLFICNSHDDPVNTLRDFARLSSKGVDGILVVSHDITQAQPAGTHTLENQSITPFVTVDWPGCAGYAVHLDLESAGYQATRHLIDHGHSRIGLITFTRETENIEPVNAGYRRALIEAKLAVDPNLVVKTTSFDLPDGAEAARRLIRIENPPTAIFAISDTLALGAMQTIKEVGLRIPTDIALVAFNDIPAAGLVEPQLTTVAAPSYQLGYEAMKMLKSLIEGKKPPHRQITLPTSLVIRKSCGCR
jgi:DNA-binding LacI/PurR family transcriptional regulator